MRTATIVIGLVDAVVWATAAFSYFLSGSSPASRDFDIVAGTVVTVFFLITAVPALVLAANGRARKTALTLRWYSR
jgi:hypothetical protein